jgi:hypothetical protein
MSLSEAATLCRDWSEGPYARGATPRQAARRVFLVGLLDAAAIWIAGAIPVVAAGQPFSLFVVLGLAWAWADVIAFLVMGGDGIGSTRTVLERCFAGVSSVTCGPKPPR